MKLLIKPPPINGILEVFSSGELELIERNRITDAERADYSNSPDGFRDGYMGDDKPLNSAEESLPIDILPRTPPPLHFPLLTSQR